MRYNLDARKETGYVGLKNSGCHVLHELAAAVPVPPAHPEDGEGGGMRQRCAGIHAPRCVRFDSV